MSLLSIRRLALSGMLALILAPESAESQFGRLKKLRGGSKPDTAAAKDTAVQAGDVVISDSAAEKPAKSRLRRAASAARKATEKFEDATGISAKDAALAATGVGVGAIAAKKLGVDPTSIASKAIQQATEARAQKAMAGATGRSATIPPGLAGMMDPTKLQVPPRGKAGSVPAMPGAVGGMNGFTEADAQEMLAFQQEMMQVAMAASGGDVKAQARLEEWNAIVLKYQPEIEKLSLNAQTGDMTPIMKLHRLQIEMMRAWSKPARKLSRPAATKSVKP